LMGDNSKDTAHMHPFRSGVGIYVLQLKFITRGFTT
jgi:hypothetical protein